MAWSSGSYELLHGVRSRGRYTTTLTKDNASVKYGAREIVSVDMAGSRVLINTHGLNTQTTARMINRFFELTNAPYVAGLKKIVVKSKPQNVPGLRNPIETSGVYVVIRNPKANVSVALYKNKAVLGLTGSMCYKLMSKLLF